MSKFHIGKSGQVRKLTPEKSDSSSSDERKDFDGVDENKLSAEGFGVYGC